MMRTMPRTPAPASAPARSPAQQELLSWYAGSARDLPWRRTRDPYRVLVSEVMLQQTQALRVVPFYERFLARFPDERALATAPLEDCHRLWKGLGYPNRVERLQAACQEVLRRGGWPQTPEQLMELPGIGPYTAGAVACFAFFAAAGGGGRHQRRQGVRPARGPGPAAGPPRTLAFGAGGDRRG